MTDGRFSGATRGFSIGHMAPEAYDGGRIAAVQNGDTITIDLVKRTITLDLPEKEIKARMKNWKRPEPKYKTGVFAKYIRDVSSASEGAVTSFVFVPPKS
jgi:dihydroxy-acid dehydratase